MGFYTTQGEYIEDNKQDNTEHFSNNCDNCDNIEHFTNNCDNCDII